MNKQREHLYLAALLHDIGKFYQRADKSLGDKENELSEVSKSIAVYTCPLNEIGYFGNQHVIWTSEFLEKFDDVFKDVVGNILSFAKGLGLHFDKEVKVSILNFEERGEIQLKMINFASFDVKFKSNVSIPNFVGLGKGVSHGFGTVVKLEVRNWKLEVRKKIKKYE
jgi:hypothetical protein